MCAVDLLPQLDGLTEVGGANYKALTEGVHSVEALELVKQHLNTILGAAPASYSNVMIKISKLQAAQVIKHLVSWRDFVLERSLGQWTVALGCQEVSSLVARHSETVVDW